MFTHGALIGVLKNSFKRVRAFQIELEFGRVVFKGEGKPEYPDKTSRSKGEKQQQIQPTYGVDARMGGGDFRLQLL